MEIWKPVVGWELSHEVSSLGQVRSIARKGSKQRVLSQQLVEGYPSVTLCFNKEKKRCYVHHLVAFAFIGTPPGEVGVRTGQFTVNHKDLDKTNNNFENLEWLTCGENYAHAYINGRVEIRSGVEIGNSKLNPEKVKEIRARLANNESPRSIASDYDVVRGTVYAIKSGKTWA